MPITMSGATINEEQRQILLSKSVDGSTVGGDFNGPGYFGATGLAGITPEFANTLTTEISEYIANIISVLSELSTVEENQAFKGTSVEKALNTFITGIKTISNRYLYKLKAAEIEIVKSVSAAYGTQDTDLSSDILGDKDTLDEANSFTTSEN